MSSLDVWGSSYVKNNVEMDVGNTFLATIMSNYVHFPSLLYKLGAHRGFVVLYMIKPYIIYVRVMRARHSATHICESVN